MKKDILVRLANSPAKLAKQAKLALLAPLASLALLAFLVTSCVSQEERPDTPTGNFEALWHIIDEHYCFFDYKDIDWNQIYQTYKVRVNDNMIRYV